MPFTRRKGLRAKDLYENFDDISTVIATIEAAETANLAALQTEVDLLDRAVPAGSVGTANTGVTATEYWSGRHHTTVLTLTNLAMPNVGDNASLAIGKLLYTLPAGAQIIRGSYMSIALTGGDAVKTDTPDVGLGSVIASGAVALLDGTATFEDIMTGQTAADINGTATVAIVNTALVRNAAAAKTVHLNVADGWADMTTLTLVASGTVVIEWVAYA
jgi:hypothetical protein